MIEHWVAFHRALGCSLRTKKEILQQCDGNIQKALSELKRRSIVPDMKKNLSIIKEIHADGCWIVPFNSPDYPVLLREIADPPMCLFGRGNRHCLSGRKIAFVGTRRATHYGLNACCRLVRDLAPAKPVIVSGMASGIDTQAHTAAMENGMETIAVLGTGLNVVYPATNRQLAERIPNSGAIITEFDPDTPPEPFRFPVRNRIISGISDGVVVVEARERSGSMITLRLALEQNREVFAVPGRLFDKASRSTNRSIRNGEAKLILDAQDILDELISFDISSKSDTVVTESDTGLLQFLMEAPRTIDELQALSSLPRDQLMIELTTLELDGRIEKNGANQFRKKV